jgi:hypothetical protein
MLMPLVYITLVADFPALCGNTFFVMKRVGRLNWLMGQMLFVWMTILTFIFIIFTASAIMSSGVFSTQWSDVVTKYDIIYPNELGNFASKLLPSNLYNQMPIVAALVQSSLLLSLYLFLLALILCLFKMMYLRALGLFFAIFIIALGVALSSSQIWLMWLFPMANSVIWLHYTEVFREPISSVSHSFIYFILITLILICTNMFVLRRTRFISTDQEVE